MRIKNNGFTMIEVLMSLVLISIIATTFIYVVDNNVDESYFEKTVSEMNEIKKALVGSDQQNENGARISFGYFGGVGSLPSVAQGLSALTTIPGAVSAWTINTSVRFGLGWNGPYLQDGDSATDYSKDAWGNDYVYSPTANPPTLTSLGADGVIGGTVFDQDIVVSFPGSERLGSVYGFLVNLNTPYTGLAEVEINYPNGSGALQQTIDGVLVADEGSFQFSSIPFGVRSITIFIPNKAAPTQTIGPILFTLDKENFLIPSESLDVSP